MGKASCFSGVQVLRQTTLEQLHLPVSYLRVCALSEPVEVSWGVLHPNQPVEALQLPTVITALRLVTCPAPKSPHQTDQHIFSPLAIRCSLPF